MDHVFPQGDYILDSLRIGLVRSCRGPYVHRPDTGTWFCSSWPRRLSVLAMASRAREALKTSSAPGPAPRPVGWQA